jgi:predicted nucleic acid-binding protein
MPKSPPRGPINAPATSRGDPRRPRYKCPGFRPAVRLIEIVLTDDIEQEYVAVLMRAKFDFPPNLFAALLDILRRHGEVVRPDPSAATSPDADDTKFLQCALAGRADAAGFSGRDLWTDGHSQHHRIPTTAEHYAMRSRRACSILG